ncbi:MAG: glutamate--tRNA ligase [Candidatus Aminicenantes bacterium]|nr:glutamate--tRNA ligase [Candidatus Aminicenantes bacterium]
MNPVRVRFAPSPTGFLHVGNARTALFNWLFARQHNGRFILRIEDTDIERSSSAYEEQLIKDLKWLGLEWDEGPETDGEFGPYRQSLRLLTYGEYTRRLLNKKAAYHCFCSKDDLEREKKAAVSEGKMPIYSGRCLTLDPEESAGRVAAGEEAAVRLKTPECGELSFEDDVRGTVSFDLSLVGDPVIVRSNGHPAYNYAVVIDDFSMNISHVIRGEDHISNMPRQLLVYQALSLPIPRFAHLSMVMGEDNTRLSKRHGATSVRQFDHDGILASALANYLALLGWAPPEDREVLSLKEMVPLFNLKKVSRSAAIFDYKKLHWLNRQHLKRHPVEQLARAAFPFLRDGGILPADMTPAHWAWLAKAVEVLIEKVDRLSDLPLHFAALFEYFPEKLDEEAREILSSDCARKVLKSVHEELKALEKVDFAVFGILTKNVKEQTGCKGKELFHPLRVALTARTSGLDLDKFIPLVEDGAELTFPVPLKNCRERISEILDYLGETGSR